jgi:nucleotide-binding universal stress UspA family protein
VAQTVLIGTSLTLASDQVVRAGLQLARASQSKIQLLHAFQAPLAYATAGPYGTPCFIPELVEVQHDQRMGRLAAQIERLGIEPQEEAGRYVLEGAPHLALADTAETIDARLIVVGAAEHSTRLLGTTADRLVRVAGRPILVTRGQLPVPPQRVLIGGDLSPIAVSAFREALRLLSTLGANPAQTFIDALLVLDTESMLAAEEAAPGVAAWTERGALEMLREQLAQEPAFRKWSVRCLVRRATSIPGEIVQMSSELESDLVVLGSHGRHGFQRFLLGSVAEYVLRYAAVSVLIVPARAHEHGTDK